MDTLTKAAFDRVMKALTGRAGGGFTEVMAKDVTMLCAAVAEEKRTEEIGSLGFGAREEERARHGRIWSNTDNLRHLLDQLA